MSKILESMVHDVNVEEVKTLKNDKDGKDSKNGKELLSIEFFEIKATKKDLEDSKLKQEIFNEAKETLSKREVHHLLVDDLTKPYLIRVEIGDKESINKKLKLLSPNEIFPEDAYELNESVTSFLKLFGIKSNPEITDKQLDSEINKDAIKKFKEIVKEKLSKIKNTSAKDKKGNNDG